MSQPPGPDEQQPGHPSSYGPANAPEDTAPLPPAPSSYQGQHAHEPPAAPQQYGQAPPPPYAPAFQPTGQLPAQPYVDQPTAGATPVPTIPGQHRRSGLGAAVLTGALLLGIGGGLAGAAGYNALDDNTTQVTGTTRAPLTTSNTATRVAAVKGSAQAVAADVLPSVVKINVASNSAQGSGSGIVLSSDGEILTNNHVVEVIADGGKMTVDFNDGTSATATVVGTDPVTDLAVVKAQGVSGLTPARIGNSDQLAVGQGVVAIGSPFGLEATVTSGIVSSLNRPVTVGESTATDTTYPAIQTDAAINPGNSGGPLVNLNGEVVGVNSSIRGSSSALGGESGSIGLGFAIPITTVLPVVEQLRNGDTPTHARLGVSVGNAASSNGLITGARIQSVENGSAGDDAGVEAGDIVTKVDDRVITSSESLVATVRGYRPGDKVTLTVKRGGSTKELGATLGSDQDSSAS